LRLDLLSRYLYRAILRQALKIAVIRDASASEAALALLVVALRIAVVDENPRGAA
jgi:hypothetical protein